VGVRNHVIVMPGVVCSSVAAQRIVEASKGAVYLENHLGCGQCVQERQRTLTVLSGLIANPNVYGAVIVGLGCEQLGEELYREAIEAVSPGKPIEYITIQQEGGISRAVRKGVELVHRMLNEAGKLVREECDMSELLLGLECGGSDPTSGASANVVLGKVSDRLVDEGGSSVISETTEFIGCEHLARDRGATPEIGKKIYDAIINKEKAFAGIGENVRDSNPSPGNKRAGLTTLEEKSLGCIRKSGTRPFTGYYDYGEQVTGKGVAFLETGAFDAFSTTAEISSGAQVVVFTTGLGNPLGSPVAPVIKMTGNHHTAEWLDDLIDFDSSATLRDEKTPDQMADELYEYIVRVCSGEKTKAELNGSDITVVDQQFMGA